MQQKSLSLSLSRSPLGAFGSDAPSKLFGDQREIEKGGRVGIHICDVSHNRFDPGQRNTTQASSGVLNDKKFRV